jgi:hypothetical protein
MFPNIFAVMLIKKAVSASSVTDTCCLMAVISGSATGLSRLFECVYNWKILVFPASVTWQHHNMELPPSDGLLLSGCHADHSRRHRNIAPVTLFVAESN